MRRRAAVVTAALAGAALLATGCSSDGGSAQAPPGSASASAGSSAPASGGGDEPSAPAKGTAEVTGTVATGLTTPWGVAVLAEGDLLVASRDTGRVVRVAADSGRTTQVGTVPGVSSGGEGGLLGLAVSRDFATDHLVYAYFTTASDNRIARMLYDPAKPAGSSWAPRTRSCAASRTAPSTTAGGSPSAPTACSTRARARAATGAWRRTRSPWAARSCG